VNEPAEPVGYLVVHLSEALALDPRTAAQDLGVRLLGDVVCVEGVVSDQDLLGAVTVVATEHAQGHPVRIDVVVGAAGEADVVEDLP
jgi:hypothetical protein